MTDNGQSNAFDLERVRSLAELMDEHELNEVDLRDGEQRIRLSRGVVTAAPTVSVTPPPAAAAPATAASTESSASSAPAEPANIAYVVSPMVGTFYTRPNPESDSYVKVGDPVGADTRICIIEAMKVFTEIPAGIAGRVVAVLCEDGEHVDVDKPLFKVDTSG